MKKILFFIVLILIVGFGIIYFCTDVFKTTEILSERDTSKLANEAYLDILIAMEDYDSNNYEEYKLLEVAMRVARELDLVKSQTDSVYLEYVPRDTVHFIIEELTGIKLNDPIVKDDFYYLYDEANDYYYIVPVGTDWIHYGKLLRSSKKGNIYNLNCTGIQSDYNDGNTIVYENMNIILQKKDNYKYIKYMLKSITHTDKIVSDNTYEKHEYNEKLLYYSFVPQDYDRTILLNFYNDTENEQSMNNLLNSIINFYDSDAETYRNTRIIVASSSHDELINLENLASAFDVEAIIDFDVTENELVGNESLAELFEEELGYNYEEKFKNYDDSYASWAIENGIEFLLVGFDDSLNFESIIKALDKVI